MTVTHSRFTQQAKDINTNTAQIEVKIILTKVSFSYFSSKQTIVFIIPTCKVLYTYKTICILIRYAGIYKLYVKKNEQKSITKYIYLVA